VNDYFKIQHLINVSKKIRNARIGKQNKDFTKKNKSKAKMFISIITGSQNTEDLSV